MTTPIVIEIRRNGNLVRPALTGPAPAAAPPSAAAGRAA